MARKQAELKHMGLKNILQGDDVKVNLSNTSEYIVSDYLAEVGSDNFFDFGEIYDDDDVNTIVFENVKFKATSGNIERNVHFALRNRQSLVFRNCTFDISLHITGAYATFEKCKFKYIVDLDNNNTDYGVITIKQCEFNITSVTLENYCNLYMSDSHKFKNIMVSRHHHDIVMASCSGHDFYLDSCHAEKCVMDWCTLKYFSVDMSYVNVMYLGNSKIDQLHFNTSLFNNSFEMDDATTKEFCADKISMFADFRFDEKKIKTWNVKRSVGIKPPAKDIIIYKKAKGYIGEAHVMPPIFDNVIVKLAVPETAKRVYCGDMKIRVSEATVLGFYSLKGKPIVPKQDYHVWSNHQYNFQYAIGATVKPELKFDGKSGSCSSGIHGFIDFTDAVMY